MRARWISVLAAGCAGALTLLTGCDRTPTAPAAAAASKPALARSGHGPAASNPTGEREVGKTAIEPAYDDVTGNLIYILTPEKAPLPTKANGHAIAPLYIVAYPPGSAVAGSSVHLNCEGVPGNCPDHDGLIASVATDAAPSVYGTDPAAVPGHDHLLAPPAGHGDFNVAWEVIEVVFTPKGETDGVTDQHLVTEAQVQQAVQDGDAREIDLGFSFTCAVVSPATYAHGTPVGGA